MRLLVTGGAGFIGSNFIRYILANYSEVEVVNFDKLTYAGNLENLCDLDRDPRYTFVKGDICDPVAVDKAVAKLGPGGVIVNFAAETHVDRSIVDPGAFIQTDVYGTMVLLEAVRKHKIARYLHISTDEVYGSRDRGSFNEASPLQPNSPYAASKAGGDLLVRSYCRTYEIPALITRSSNNYGPYQYPEKLIPLFITNLLEKKKVPLYGDGKNVRDWLHVEDNCAAIALVLQKGKSGEIYNIGGGNERQNLEITGLILEALDLDPKKWVEPVKDRPGHDRRYSVDCGKIRRLGWRPAKPFESGLKETIDWYRENRKWWKKIRDKQLEFKKFYQQWYQKKS
ncbi:MAG: dTDP-glucose 4,6-dehydratase [Candidatus Margulisiibacteriota bacterium]|jgi:dTDP-glucose 4,6-dehydratase